MFAFGVRVRVFVCAVLCVCARARAHTCTHSRTRLARAPKQHNTPQTNQPRPPRLTGDDVGHGREAVEAAGAKGIISAGFAPGFAGPGDFIALEKAHAAGVIVMQCTRAGSGRMFKGKRLREAGFLITDNLTPQKARLLLALALTKTSDPTEIERMFLEY